MHRPEKQHRHRRLKEMLGTCPFLTDEELAVRLGVSIQTIRLDRLSLGIPEVRERTKQMAEEAQVKIKAIASDDVTGEIMDLTLGRSALSVLAVSPDMMMEKTRVARGHHVFAQANSLALAVIDAPAAVTGVANLKFKAPVTMGQKLIAKAEVVRKRGNKHFVWVRTHNENLEELFRAKFIMVSLP